MKRLASFAASLLVLASCASTPDIEPEWIEADLKAPSEDVLWHLTSLALEKEGFPIGGGMDPTNLVAETGWHNSLQPFARDGWREQATVRLERGEAGAYHVSVRVQKEINVDNVRPLDPSFAKWEGVADDTARAKVILQRIRAYLGSPLDVGEPKKNPFGR